jgi:hypothetical protein
MSRPTIGSLLVIPGIGRSSIQEKIQSLDPYLEDEHDELAADDDDSPWEISSDSDGPQEKPIAAKLGRPSNPFAAPVEPHVGSSQPPELQLIDFIVGCLWKLPIRRPAPLDRLKGSDAAESACYHPYDIMHVRSKFPTLNESVTVRLGKAISRRRQILRYRKEHLEAVMNVHSHTKRRIVRARDVEGDLVMEAPAASLVASTRHTAETKATTLRLDAHQQTQASLDTLYAPSVATSMSSETSGQSADETPLVYPMCPKAEDGNILHEFICPFCHTAQRVSTERRWR